MENIYLCPIANQGLPPLDPVTGIPWVQNGFAGGPTIEWDILPPGLGIGAPNPASPISMDSMFFEVASGTAHGILPGWIHSWSLLPGGGSSQVNIVSGFLSGPVVPEPTTLMLLGGGLLGIGASLRFRKKNRP